MSEDLRYRLGGALCLAIGLAAAWFGLWRPLEAARAGAGEVSWILRIAVLVPLTLIFGLFFLLTGARYPYRDVERQTLTPVGWTLFAVIGVASFGCWWWMKTTLEALGYR